MKTGVEVFGAGSVGGLVQETPKVAATIKIRAKRTIEIRGFKRLAVPTSATRGRTTFGDISLVAANQPAFFFQAMSRVLRGTRKPPKSLVPKTNVMETSNPTRHARIAGIDEYAVIRRRAQQHAKQLGHNVAAFGSASSRPLNSARRSVGLQRKANRHRPEFARPSFANDFPSTSL